MPLVTIVIPTYNQADFLREAMQSVLDQTISDWEMVVINNFSSDNTIDVVKEFSDDRIRLINFANNGVIGSSRNIGIQKARSIWVAFLDSDDIWYPGKLEHCLKDASRVDVIAHRLEVIRNNSVIGTSAIVTANDFLYKRLVFGRNCLTPTATIVRKELLDKVGGFSENKEMVTAEDFDLCSNYQGKMHDFAFTLK
jgi:teichuronic acid biosynthesis glycosyltransferase TuaG